MQQAAEVIAEPLRLIYNQSLDTGTVPLVWKRSNVTPVHKGGVVDNPSNFCPISVVSIVMKILEKVASCQSIEFIFRDSALT